MAKNRSRLVPCALVLTAAALAAYAAKPASPPMALSLQNAALEDAGTDPAAIPGWTLRTTGTPEATLSLDTAQPYSSLSPHTLKLTATALKPGGDPAAGVMAVNGAPLSVRKGQIYDVQFVARKGAATVSGGGAPAGIGLVFSLASADGKTIAAATTIPEIGRASGGPARSDGVGPDGWQVYTLSLEAHADVADGRLTIAPIDPGTLWLDEIAMGLRGTVFKMVERGEVAAATGPGSRPGRGGAGAGARTGHGAGRGGGGADAEAGLAGGAGA